MEDKLDNEPLISPTGDKNESTGKQWDPIKSMLHLLLLKILIRIPLCFYDVYITDGLFSRRFAVFLLSASVVALMYTLVSKGANNPKKLEIHGVTINHLLMLMNFVIAPLRLYEVYLTDGVFSGRFAHFALCAFSLGLVHLRLSKMIPSGPCVVLMLLSFISSVVLHWDLLFFVTTAGCLILLIVICYAPGLYEKGFDKKSDGKDISFFLKAARMFGLSWSQLVMFFKYHLLL